MKDLQCTRYTKKMFANCTIFSSNNVQSKNLNNYIKMLTFSNGECQLPFQLKPPLQFFVWTPAGYQEEIYIVWTKHWDEGYRWCKRFRCFFLTWLKAKRALSNVEQAVDFGHTNGVPLKSIINERGQNMNSGCNTIVNSIAVLGALIRKNGNSVLTC